MCQVLVCGGRDFHDQEGAFAALDQLHAQIGITRVIEGGARGADTIASEWAASRDIPNTCVKADWERHGRSAGYKRNRDMLTLQPNLVAAFPGGRGTENMLTIARQAGVKTLRFVPR